MVIVLRSTEPLPFLSASKITDEPRVEVGYASPGMHKRILSEVAPEIEASGAHSRFSGNFAVRGQMHAVIGPQPVALRELARLATQRRRQLDSEVLGPLGFEREW